MGSIDSAKQKMEELIAIYEDFRLQDLSESDTRSKILDYILIKVLGYEEYDITREGYTEPGYYDYKISLPNFQFIIEAKKDYSDLKLPTKHFKTKINTLLAGNKDVIEQIIKYLVGEGVTYGIITNGHQFIIGRFINTDGSRWKENTCIIFNGFSDINSRFIDFYNLLSKNATRNNSLLNYLSEERQEGQTIFSKLGAKRHKELIRNDLTASLIPILSNIFGEIYKFETLDNKELLKECFIKNEETKKSKSEIERLIDDRPPDLKEVIPVVNTDNTINYIKKTVTQPIENKETPPPDPIIIIGSKGAGKTTFINYLFEVSLDPETLSERPFVYLDFRKYDDLGSEKEQIYKDILSSIERQYPDLNLYDLTVLKRTFYREINQKDKGVWKHIKDSDTSAYNERVSTLLDEALKNPIEHFNKLSEYLIREKRKRLTIIIDNADQKGPAFQKEAYLLGASINRIAKCAIIISLREGYYYRWRNKPPFDAFQSTAYHVTAPPYGEVLKGRIDFALKKIDINEATRGVVDDKKITVSPETVLKFFLNLDKTLFSVDNSEMLHYLEETSYPNIREGLESFRKFLLSGHTNVHKYVMSQEFSIPIWEFIKSIALNNNLYYNNETSEIKNIFYPAKNNYNHFTKIRILRFLFNTTKKLGFREKFVPLEDIVDLFLKIGYTKEVIMDELFMLVDYKLIDTDNYVSDIEGVDSLLSESNFCISLRGVYYIEQLMNRFHYLNLVLQSTPIFDNDTFKKLNTTFPLCDEIGYQVLSERLQSVQLFIEYLEKQEFKEMKKSSLDESLSFSITNHIRSMGLDKDIHRIKKALHMYS